MTLPHIASFINIGCSAFALKSPARYASIAFTLLISSSLKPYVASDIVRKLPARITAIVSAIARVWARTRESGRMDSSDQPGARGTGAANVSMRCGRQQSAPGG